MPTFDVRCGPSVSEIPVSSVHCAHLFIERGFAFDFIAVF
jgi:hypothetical protein